MLGGILKAKQERADHQQRMAKLIGLRRLDGDTFDANALVPGPSWRKVAEDADVPLAHVIAVFMVESAGSGFDDEGRLTVLYEPHIAYKYAKRPKEAQLAEPQLFYPRWVPSSRVPARQWHPYRTSQDDRWDMIARAAKIDFDAAVAAVSWGRFQVMGFHAKNLDFDNALHMIEHMYDGEENHLDVFLRYCRMAGLMPALRKGDWWGFSKYNSSVAKVRKAYAAKCESAAQRAQTRVA